MSRKYLCSRHSCAGACAEIRVKKVGREVARLVKEESRLIPEPSDVSVVTRKGLQMYGNCDLYVFCWYVCRLFVVNYGAVSTNQDDPFCFQRILLFLTRAQKNVINKPRVVTFTSVQRELC